MAEFWEFGSGFNDYLKIYLVQNVEFLTGVPKDAPAFIEKFN